MDKALASQAAHRSDATQTDRSLLYYDKCECTTQTDSWSLQLVSLPPFALASKISGIIVIMNTYMSVTKSKDENVLGEVICQNVAQF
jgi:hypothetical protein